VTEGRPQAPKTKLVGASGGRFFKHEGKNRECRDGFLGMGELTGTSTSVFGQHGIKPMVVRCGADSVRGGVALGAVDSGRLPC